MRVVRMFYLLSRGFCLRGGRSSAIFRNNFSILVTSNKRIFQGLDGGREKHSPGRKVAADLGLVINALTIYEHVKTQDSRQLRNPWTARSFYSTVAWERR